jgi:hypothetical protein
MALYVAAVLIAVLLGSLAREAALESRWRLAVVLVAFIAVAALALLGLVPELVVDAATIIAVLAAALVGEKHRPFRYRLSPIAFGAAFTLAAMPVIAAKAAPELQLPVVEIFMVAEATAIVAAIALLARHIGAAPASRSLIVAAAAAGITFLALTMQPATVEILMLWNLGLAGYFHPAVYAAAAAAIAYALHRSWRTDDQATMIGVGFLIAGGIGLHSTLQSAAALIGIVLLSQARPEKRAKTLSTHGGTRLPTPQIRSLR